MKRLINALVVVALALAALPTTALAEHLSGNNSWSVTYTADGKLKDNFSSAEYVDDISGLQPGDDITFTIKLTHDNETSADWYLSNDVVKSLEEGAAKGSAYEYVLTYEGPSNSRTLYESHAVGGDAGNGLLDADSALKDYLALETLSKGQSATVTLKVTLDGETEGNDYFNTIAQLKLKFALEPLTESSSTTTNTDKTTTDRRVVATGDDNHLFPFYVAMVVSGVALLVLTGYSVHLLRDEREEGQR